MKYIFIVIFCSSVFAQTFEQDALQYLQKQYPGYDKVEIQLQKNFASDEIITVDKSRNISISRGFAIVPVIATRGLKTSASIVSVKVTLYKKLFVAIRDFDRKESLNQAEFETRLIDVTILNGTPVGTDFLFNDYRSKSFIKKGEILLEEKLEKIPLISAGDKVRAEVKNGSVLISTELFARQQGSKGDLIEFVSPENKIIKARILDANNVIVER